MKEHNFQGQNKKLHCYYNTNPNPYQNDKKAPRYYELKKGLTFGTHARQQRIAHIGFGWFQIRLPETQQILWVLVAHDFVEDHDLILVTNVPLEQAETVRQVYADWRQRGNVEHGYRFDQEEGLDVEDIRVETLERMRRLFILVLLAAQFVYYIGRTWTKAAVMWLRQLGGKLGLRSDLDGPYVLLRGLSAVWQTVATLTFAARHPFPRDS